MIFPVLTNLRYKKVRKKFNVGEINLRFIERYNFLYNSSFNLKKIKYNKNYSNEQNSSDIFKNHMLNIRKIIDSYFHQKVKICEIGSGKGSFFELLAKKYKNIVGYDVTYHGNNKQIFKRYLTKKDRIISDLIIMRHTLEHISKPFDFLKMLNKISINDPYIFIEVPNLKWIIKKKAFWDIGYEHVNYFSKKTFNNLFKKLIINKEVFGGQYLVILAKLSELNLKYGSNIKGNKISFNKFFPNIKEKIQKIEKINCDNIYFWGAASKSLMFLCHCYQRNKLVTKVKYIVDIDIDKQNHYLQIVNKKIISPKKFFSVIKKNDLVIISNSIYSNEIKNFIIKKLRFNIKYITLD